LCYSFHVAYSSFLSFVLPHGRISHFSLWVKLSRIYTLISIPPKYCPNCDFIHYRNPLPVVLAIAIKDKKFLLIKRGIAPKKGRWASPSGFIEVGETPEQACLRELKEETGISGRILKLIGIERREEKEIYGDMVVIKYLIEVDEGELTPGDEVDKVKFFEIPELPNYYMDRFKQVIEKFC